jgi:hypothetical protein
MYFKSLFFHNKNKLIENALKCAKSLWYWHCVFSAFKVNFSTSMFLIHLSVFFKYISFVRFMCISKYVLIVLKVHFLFALSAFFQQVCLTVLKMDFLKFIFYALKMCFYIEKKMQ